MPFQRCVIALLSGLCVGSVSCSPGHGSVADNPDLSAASGDLSAGATGDLRGGDLTTAECAATQYVAQQAPAAMLVLLDRSMSMAGSKWAAAQQAIIQAIDQDAFDSMSLGLISAPALGEVTGPACIFNLPVSCGAPTQPQVAIQPAGTSKSTAASGVRSQINTWLMETQPDNGIGDASPLYVGTQVALAALQAWPMTGKRILLIVTDGSLDCGSLANPPRSGFTDCNGCKNEWEDPRNMMALVSAANMSATTPVDSFVIGVPGSDTYDPTGCNQPPYYMRGALSAIAYAGSPANTPAGCTGTTFTPPSMNPTVSCHIDMTQGTFNAQALATNISQIRGKALGCEYELPPAPDGGTLDRGEVNVSYTSNGQVIQAVRRMNQADACTSHPCWDYDAAGKIELIGQSCTAVTTGTGVQVHIGVGCVTVVG